MLVEHRAGGFPVDTAVVEPLREADEIPGEAVAPHMRYLPHPLGIELVPQPLVERAAVPRAAGVVLAVCANEEERVAGRLTFPELDAAQLLVVADLDPRQLLLARNRRRCEHDQLGPLAAIRPADEEQPSVLDG